jgi:hypothetical protein
LPIADPLMTSAQRRTKSSIGEWREFTRLRDRHGYQPALA